MKGYFFSSLGFRVVLVLIGILLCSSMFAQDVHNVKFRQEGNKVIINYSLSSKSAVSIFVSTDGGSSFGDALKKVKGDVGANVSAGKNMIIWSPLEEMTEIKGSDIVFLITATAKTERFSNTIFFNNYLGGVAVISPIESVIGIGLNVGSVRNFGWYADVFVGEAYTGYDAKETLAISVGSVFRANQNSAFTLGVGATFCGEFRPYYGDPEFYDGIHVTAGYNIFIKSFSLTAQVSTLNFRTLELRLGIGWCLRR